MNGSRQICNLMGPVLQIDRLPVADADGADLAPVGHIDELLARAGLLISAMVLNVPALDR
jgi:hypothetical protein